MNYTNPGAVSLRRFAYVPDLLDLELDEAKPGIGVFPVPVRGTPTVEEVEERALRDLYHEVSICEHEFSTWELVAQWFADVWGGPRMLPAHSDPAEEWCTAIATGVAQSNKTLTVPPQSIVVKEESLPLEGHASYEEATRGDLIEAIPFVKRIVAPPEAGVKSSPLREITSQIRRLVAKHEKDERERQEQERQRLEEEKRDAERKEVERIRQEEEKKAAAEREAAEREALYQEAKKQRIAQEIEEAKKEAARKAERATVAAKEQQETPETDRLNQIIDCEPARQWSTLFSEWHTNGTAMIQNFKSDPSHEVKQLRLSVKKAVTLGVNQLSATHAQVARSSMNFVAALRQHEKNTSNAYLFSLWLGSTAIIDHSEGQILANPPSVWSYAYLLKSIIAAHPTMQRVFDSTILDRTCHVIPAYLLDSHRLNPELWFSSKLMGDEDSQVAPLNDKVSTEDGTGSWGTVKGESLLQYCQRTSGNVRLWLSVCVVQQRFDALWKWFAQLVQLETCTLASAFLLAAALDVAAWAALSEYKRQFAKLLRLLNSYYMPKLEALQRTRKDAGFLTASISHIRVVLDGFLTTGTLPVPEGFNLQDHCRPIGTL